MAAIVAQGICAMLMTLTPFPQLVIYIGFSLTFFTVMSVASLLGEAIKRIHTNSSVSSLFV